LIVLRKLQWRSSERISIPSLYIPLQPSSPSKTAGNVSLLEKVNKPEMVKTSNTFKAGLPKRSQHWTGAHRAFFGG